MRAYKIIKVTKGDYTHYEIREKRWLSWRTITDGGVDGIGSYNYPYTFKTEEAAEGHIRQYYAPEIKTTTKIISFD